MAELTISINSRAFQIMCADGEEAQVKKLAEDLATRVGSLKDHSAQAGDSHLLVLAGLTLCSELRDLHRDMANTKDELKRLNEARGALNERINDMEETIADALTSAAERVEALLEETGTAATAKADTQSAMPSDDSAAEDIIVAEETDTAIDENEADDAL
ncbi:MAG: cell division protein ZapA [Rhodobiaceae bacterium]|jgi:cell division protein ZapA